MPPRQGAKSRGSFNWGDQGKSRQVGVKQGRRARTPGHQHRPPVIKGERPSKGPPESGEGRARALLASPECGQSTDNPHPSSLPGAGRPREAWRVGRSGHRGLSPGAGSGSGTAGSGGPDSPWREARRDRRLLGGCWDARPVSGAPRAGSLSRWGWGSRRSRGGCLGPSPPASSCPPSAPGAARTPSSPRGCVGTLLVASARSQGQHYRKLRRRQARTRECLRTSPPSAVPLLSGLVLERERGERESECGNQRIRGAAGGACGPTTRSRNSFLDDTAGRARGRPSRASSRSAPGVCPRVRGHLSEEPSS